MKLWGISLKMRDKYDSIDQLSDDAKALLVEQVKEEVLKRITVRPVVHKMVLTGEADMGVVLSRLGTLSETMDRTIPNRQHSWRTQRRTSGVYRRWDKVVYKGYPLDIFTLPVNRGPNDAGPRRCKVEFSYPTPAFLDHLDSQIPDFEISTVEFAVDFIFREPFSAKNFFHLFKHYFFVERFHYDRQRQGDFTAAQIANGQNRVRNLKMLTFSTGGYEYVLGRKVKVYGRGPDKLKRGGHWHRKDLCWVRVEFKIPKAKLRGPVIDDDTELPIDDRHAWNAHHPNAFTANCHFHDLIGEQFLFKVFNGSQDWLPKEWGEYHHHLDPDCNDCFQSQYLRSKEEAGGRFVKARHTANASGFAHLQWEIKRQLKDFDQKWSFQEYSLDDDYITPV